MVAQVGELERSDQVNRLAGAERCAAAAKTRVEHNDWPALRRAEQTAQRGLCVRGFLGDVGRDDYKRAVTGIHHTSAKTHAMACAHNHLCGLSRCTFWAV